MTGYIVKQRSSADLIDKMLTFIELPYEDKIRMGIEGRNKVETEFNRRIVVDAYMKELEQI